MGEVAIMAKMADRLVEIYDFIEVYNGQHGCSPSCEAITEALGATKTVVAHHLETMEHLGMIVRPRGVQVIQLRSRQPDWAALAQEG
jgi:SOS-response transcriptional repressor LexA